ncbi:MAG TPA: hypothetical protein VGO09_09930, partial [Flavisolibacter sp.]|nr:hypothetical protein [Flavisolibacter sp.]
LCKLHPVFQTPYISIVCCSVVVSFLIFWAFEELLIIDIILYGAGLSLEFVALILLRIKEPGLNRPFKIPLNAKGLFIMLLVPFAIYIFALVSAVLHSEDTLSSALFAIIALCSAPVIWWIISLRKKIIAKGIH